MWEKFTLLFSFFSFAKCFWAINIRYNSYMPGVYQMIGEDNVVLYVWKTRNLQKRVRSYAHQERLPHSKKNGQGYTRSACVGDLYRSKGVTFRSKSYKINNPPYNTLRNIANRWAILFLHNINIFIAKKKSS